MQRRSFITLLGGAAAAWPLAAGAQQPRRVGVLMGSAATDPTGQGYLATFMQGLRKLGWIDGQNLQIEVRWSGADLRLTQAYATDLVGLFKPDVLLANGRVVYLSSGPSALWAPSRRTIGSLVRTCTRSRVWQFKQCSSFLRRVFNGP
jgi:hypothetical protein